MAIYKLSNDSEGNPCSCIKTDENPPVIFPVTDSNNRYYIEYKEWLDAGNTPDPSDQTVYKLTNRT